MTYRVLIYDHALTGVKQYLDYIADEQQQPLNALRWWEKALRKVFTLEYMPQRCPYAPENQWSDHELRMLIVDRCLFIFHIDDAARTVEVVKFRHGSQLPSPLDSSDDD